MTNEFNDLRTILASVYYTEPNPSSLGIRHSPMLRVRRQLASLRRSPIINTACAALLLALSSPCLAAHFEDSDTAVEAGREALDRWSDYPWYDDQSDGVRRIDVEAAQPPPQRDAPDLNWDLGANLVRWLVWSALALLLAFCAYAIIRAILDRETRTAARTAAAAPPDRDDLDRVEALPFPVQAASTDLLGRANELRSSGQFAQAIVYLYSHLLVQLDRSQLIRLTRGKTNRQYLREAQRNGLTHELLGTAMVAFEDVFFGHHGLSRDRFEQCWSGLDQFHQHLQRTEA
jgi:hypothetical protein